jgi:hypothetical protein
MNNEQARHTGRMKPEEAAYVLGVQPHDIPILIRAKLLKPLANPPPNAVKYFAATKIQRLAADEQWLEKATKNLNNYWAEQNKNRKNKKQPE